MKSSEDFLFRTNDVLERQAGGSFERRTMIVGLASTPKRVGGERERAVDDESDT